MATPEQISRLGEFYQQADEIYYFDSAIPKACKTKDCLLGIDEAGRGPVLGPMVYGAAYYPLAKKKNLDGEKKFQDSKQLTEADRSSMFAKINEFPDLGYFTTILSPVVISTGMLKRSKYNLNALSHDTAIALINKALELGVQLKEVYIDTVGPADKYEAKLAALFPSLKIKVANKADSLFKIVSVASICAKYVRDHLIKHWQFIERPLAYTEIDYGSGYPGDPKTKEFLRRSFDPLFGFSTFVRFSWSTVTKIMDEKAIDVEWDDDNSDDDEEEQGNATKKAKTLSKPITNFFKWRDDDLCSDDKKAINKGIEDKKLHTSSFFTERDIYQVSDVSAHFT